MDWASPLVAQDENIWLFLLLFALKCVGLVSGLTIPLFLTLYVILCVLYAEISFFIKYIFQQKKKKEYCMLIKTI